MHYGVIEIPNEVSECGAITFANYILMGKMGYGPENYFDSSAMLFSWFSKLTPQELASCYDKDGHPIYITFISDILDERNSFTIKTPKMAVMAHSKYFNALFGGKFSPDPANNIEKYGCIVHGLANASGLKYLHLLFLYGDTVFDFMKRSDFDVHHHNGSNGKELSSSFHHSQWGSHIVHAIKELKDINGYYQIISAEIFNKILNCCGDCLYYW